MRYTFIFILLVLVSCSDNACKSDTEFGIRYKTVDGSWEGPLYWDLPHDAAIKISDDHGSYYLSYTSKCQQKGFPIRLRNAVIDFRITQKTLLYDTTKTKVELIK